MKANENKEERRLVEEQRRAKEKERQLKRTTEERGSTGGRGPRR